MWRRVRTICYDPKVPFQRAVTAGTGFPLVSSFALVDGSPRVLYQLQTSPPGKQGIREVPYATPILRHGAEGLLTEPIRGGIPPLAT